MLVRMKMPPISSQGVALFERVRRCSCVGEDMAFLEKVTAAKKLLFSPHLSSSESVSLLMASCSVETSTATSLTVKLNRCLDNVCGKKFSGD